MSLIATRTSFVGRISIAEAGAALADLVIAHVPKPTPTAPSAAASITTSQSGAPPRPEGRTSMMDLSGPPKGCSMLSRRV